MAALSALLAGLLVVIHLLFVVFAALGALLVLRWRRVAWAHLPAAAWAVFIEMSGGICPLTPWENAFRARAGLDVYSGDFIARYIFPLLYPQGLTRGMQVAIGTAVLLVNLALYALVLRRNRV